MLEWLQTETAVSEGFKFAIWPVDEVILEKHNNDADFGFVVK